MFFFNLQYSGKLSLKKLQSLSSSLFEIGPVLHSKYTCVNNKARLFWHTDFYKRKKTHSECYWIILIASQRELCVAFILTF